MRRVSIFLIVALVAFVVVSVTPRSASALFVDVKLAMLVDVSGSVDSGEFALQRDGYVNAFRDTSIINAITNTSNGAYGKIAATFVYWSGDTQQFVVAGSRDPWTLIDSAATSNSFADLIAGTARPFGNDSRRRTAPGSAINFVMQGFDYGGYEATKSIIDVSGDGAENDGADTSDARDAALAAGINAINGLPILGQSGLEAWYTNNIMGGKKSFVIAASDFASFDKTVYDKIYREIPEPSSLLLLSFAFLGLVGYGRKKKK